MRTTSSQRQKLEFELVCAGLALIMLVPTAGALSTTWTTATGDWYVDVGNWSAGVPGAGDDAVIASGTVLLTNSTAPLISLSVGSATMVVSNWSTAVIATNVVLGSGASVTLPAEFSETEMSNRVHIVCSNLTLVDGAVIDVSGRGYDAEQGPGNPMGASHATIGSGAGYGGRGGKTTSIVQAGGPTYGSTNAPLAPGSGGGRIPSGSNYGGPGGGAVRVEAHTVTIDGDILADGSDGTAVNPNSNYGGGGSGGAVYITCTVFGGAASGLISANGGDSFKKNTTSGASNGGGGGRIAIAYSSTSGSVGVRFSAAAGTPDVQNPFPVQFGTIHLPNADFFSDAMDQFLGGLLVVPGLTSFAADHLTLTNGLIGLGSAALTVTVTNDVLIGSSGGLLLGQYGGAAETSTLSVGKSVLIDGGILRMGEELDNDALSISLSGAVPVLEAGSLVLTNSGALHVHSGSTNGVVDYGALVSVTGDVSIAASSWIHPHAHPENGGTVLFQLNDLTILSGAGFDASSFYATGTKFAVGRGYYSDQGPGTGDGSYGGGAGYGGAGGDSGNAPQGGPTYGSTNAPVDPGSGGGRFSTLLSRGGSGGGAVRIEAANVTLDGTLSASGSAGVTPNHGGGGAGGTVFVNCDTFSGTGSLVADGGNGGPGSSPNGPGGGGGGRIAVWYNVLDADAPIIKAGGPLEGLSVSNAVAGFSGTVSVTNGIAFNGGFPGEVGTFVFLTVVKPPAGTLMWVK